MKTVEIFLIPSPLSNDKTDILFDEDKKVLAGLSTFFVENQKTARRHLKALLPEIDLHSLTMYVLDEHSRTKYIESLIEVVLKVGRVGIISEAGYPGIADPGTEFIRLAHMKNISVRPLWGTSSIFLALAASGLSAQKFTFNGYLPRPKTLRIQAIVELETESKIKSLTQVFIEAPYRNIHLWQDLLRNCKPETEISIAVNLTAKSEYIKTARVVDWKKMKWPEINGIPTVFMLNAS